MLKRFGAFNISLEGNEEEYERIVALFQVGYDKFKYNSDDAIIFRSEDQKDIEKYLGVSLESNENFREFIDYYDGGEYLQVANCLQIGINECIEKVKENFEQYEDRIWQAQDSYKEITKIIKEQMYKVFIGRIQGCFEIINNGNFKWN